jgi:hypothetical protein
MVLTLEQYNAVAASIRKVKVNLSLRLTKNHDTKTHGGRGIAPRILNLATR